MTPDDDLVAHRPVGRHGPADRVRVLRARPTVDAAAAAELRREARVLLARSAGPIVVDLTDVRDVEPTHVFGVFRDLASEAGEADVDLRVVRGPRATRTTRTLLGDEDLFEIYPTLVAALQGRDDDDAPRPARTDGASASDRERAPRAGTPGPMPGDLIDRASAARRAATRLVEQAARARRCSSAVVAGLSSRVAP
jgi:anti-anti-sigma regulatory factor